MTPGRCAIVVCLATLPTFSASGVRAQTVTVAEPVVVTASRIPAAATAGSVTVISREQIDRQRPVSTIEILRQVPGLHIDQPGGRGGVSSVFMRGSDPNFTLVLIDGVRVNDPTNSRGGSFDFTTLDPGSIERIEVVRGPFSAVYGSDAIGGVINIITRGGAPEATATAQVGGGRFEYRRGWAELRGPVAAGDFALNVAYVDNGEPVEGSEFTGKSANGNLTLALSDLTMLRLTSRLADNLAKSFPDDSGGPSFAVLRGLDKRDSRELTVGVALSHQPRDGPEYVIDASYYDRVEDFVSPGIAPGVRDPVGIVPNSSDDRFRRETISAHGVFSLAERVDLSLGAEAIFEQGSSDSELVIGGVVVPGEFDLARQVYAPFAEARVWFPVGLTLEGGLRIDFPRGFDTEPSPRLGARQTFDATGTTLRASWGEGFKLPSFFALGHPIVGNADLVPETSESVEVGVEQRLWNGRADLRAVFFHNRFFDLVDFDEGPPPRLVNRSEVTAEGVELGFDVRPMEVLALGGHLTYTSTDIEGTTEELRNRPEWRAGGSALWRPRPDVTVALDALYVGEVLDSSIPTGDRILDPYLRFDVAVTWAVLTGVEVSLAIDNLFDADYEEAVGFPAPGIRPRIAVRTTF